MHSMVDDGFWANMGPGNCPKETSKFVLKGGLPKNNSTFLEQMTVMSSIQGISLKFLKDINTEHERLVLSGFFTYGYSSDWVTANLHRVRAKVLPTKDYMSKTVYSVDQQDLFAVVDKIEFGVHPLESLEANFTSSIEYIYPIEKGE